MSLTIAVPKQSKLRQPFNELLSAAGFEYSQEDKIIIDKKGLLPDISARVLKDSAALANLCETGPANITIAPVGTNAYKEFALACENMPPVSVPRVTDVSACTLCLAGKPEDNVAQNGLDTAKGRTIVTSYPNILQDTLKKAGIQTIIQNQDGTSPSGAQNAVIYPENLATIIVRPGSVEEEAALRGALACDLVQTGNSLKNEGFDTQTMLPILKSTLIFAKSSISNLSPEEENIANSFLERVVPTKETEQIATPQIIIATNTPQKYAIG